MRFRWTADAADDLNRICDYLAETNADAAQRTAQTIVDGVASLRAFPNRGRPGRVSGTREFVFAHLPFVAVYQVTDEVQVLRILHGAKQWPPAQAQTPEE
jgi:toxin ParE1/3/4